MLNLWKKDLLGKVKDKVDAVCRLYGIILSLLNSVLE